MRKILDNVVAMPSGCETSRFVACFTSMFMRAEGMTEENIEVYCPKQIGNCIECGDCPGLNRLRKKHEQVYNLFSVVSGYGFMQIDLSNDIHMSRDWDVTCDIMLREFDDYVKFTMDFAGYRYEVFTSSDDRDTLSDRIRNSIDYDKPVLMQFEQGLSWVVVTGYDDDGCIYGYDGSYEYWGRNLAEPDSYGGKLFRMADWHAKMTQMIILSEPFEPTMTMTDVYCRAAKIMEHTCGLFTRSEQYMLDDANFVDLDADSLVKMRDRISQFIGLPIDMRSVVSWHIPVPSDKVLIRHSKQLSESDIDPCEREHLFTMMNWACCYIHDTLWIAWRAVGEFMGGTKEEWGQRLSDPAIRRVVADVIGIVAHYDRDIYDVLKRLAGEKS